MKFITREDEIRQAHAQARKNALQALESVEWFVKCEPKETEIVGEKELNEMSQVAKKLERLQEYLQGN